MSGRRRTINLTPGGSVLEEMYGNESPGADTPADLVADDTPSTVSTSRVALNPVNPRSAYRDLGRLRSVSKDFTDLDVLKGLGVEFTDLESMRTMGQLAPSVVVSRTAFLEKFPEHEAVLAEADFVTLDGSRRRVAIEAFGIPTIVITVSDHLVSSRADFRAAAIAAIELL